MVSRCWKHAMRSLFTLALYTATAAGYAQDKSGPICPTPTGPAVTTTPAPRSGNVKGIGDWVQHTELQGATAAKTPFDIYLVGDSLAQHWPPEILHRRLPKATGMFNLGVAGDRTENVLWRLQRTRFPPGLRTDIVNLIGTNNLDRPGCEVVWGIAAVLEEEQRLAPAARLIVISLLPRGRDLASFADKIATINHDLALLSDAKGYLFVNTHDELLCGAYAKGRCPYYQGDQIHLRREGYEVITNALAASLAHQGNSQPASPSGSSRRAR
jgi:platelet-activating factor acetylhydrolase IB subunit beta/gamma